MNTAGKPMSYWFGELNGALTYEALNVSLGRFTRVSVAGAMSARLRLPFNRVPRHGVKARARHGLRSAMGCAASRAVCTPRVQ